MTVQGKEISHDFVCGQSVVEYKSPETLRNIIVIKNSQLVPLSILNLPTRTIYLVTLILTE